MKQRQSLLFFSIVLMLIQVAQSHMFRTFHHLFIPNNNHSVLSLELLVNETSANEIITVTIKNVNLDKPELDVPKKHV
jgi:hypothetical protein